MRDEGSVLMVGGLKRTACDDSRRPNRHLYKPLQNNRHYGAKETLIYSPAAYMHMGEFGLYRA